MIFLHGFLGEPSDWASICPLNSQGCNFLDWSPIFWKQAHPGSSKRPIKVPSKSPGMSPSAGPGESPTENPLAALAHTLNENLDENSQNILVGYSMGGRIALHMLLDAPERFQSALIISASPGLADPEARQTRLTADKKWAERFRHDDWSATLDAWNRQAVFQNDDLPPWDRTSHESEREKWAWTVENGSPGLQKDLRNRLRDLNVPILFAAGELDSKYKALAQECADLNPIFACSIVAGGGHRWPWAKPIAFHDLLNQVQTMGLKL